MSLNKMFTLFSEELIADLEWKVFEDLCCAYFTERDVRAEKNDAYHTNRVAAIYLFKNGEDRPSTMIQCKAWHTERVDGQMVKAFLEDMKALHISRGIFMASGLIPANVRNLATNEPITIISGHCLFKLIQALPIEAQQRLLQIAIQDGYNIPTCHFCGLKMERNMHHHGDNKGEYYWGCSGAPQCLHTLQMH